MFALTDFIVNDESDSSTIQLNHGRGFTVEENNKGKLHVCATLDHFSEKKKSILLNH